MRPELVVGGICLGLIVIVGSAAIGRASSSDPPAAAQIDPAYSAAAPTKQVVLAAPAHHWVTRRGNSFGYPSAMSSDDAAAGLATKALVMIDFNGMVQGDYSFTTYNPVSGNMIVMRCAEPCAYMNVINYDHRMPETFPVTRGSVMEAMVLDARAGFLNPTN